MLLSALFKAFLLGPLSRLACGTLRRLEDEGLSNRVIRWHCYSVEIERERERDRERAREIDRQRERERQRARKRKRERESD